jgi:hypothetical protein
VLETATNPDVTTVLIADALAARLADEGYIALDEDKDVAAVIYDELAALRDGAKPIVVPI